MNHNHESGDPYVHLSDGKGQIIRELESLLPALKEINHSLFVSAQGVSLAYAMVGARTIRETVAISEGFIVSATDLPVCRMVLTSIRFDPAIRCVAVIGYTPQFVATAESMLMEVCVFNRSQEPPGDPTHDWGVAFCCEKIDGVPDIIYDTGCAGKDPLIRILGDNPTRVLASINRILSRIINTKFTEE